MARTTSRAESTSTRSGAIEASAQATATMARAAGPQAVTSGQGRLGHGIGQAGGPGVQRDGPEADGHGQGHGQVGQAEDDRLGGQVGQVAPDPGGRRDGHRAGHDRRSQDAHPDRRAGPAAERGHAHERPEDAAGRRGQHGDARVGQGQGQTGRAQDGEGHGTRVAARAGGRPDDDQDEPDDRPEDEVQADVGGRGDAAAADEQAVGRADGQGRDRSRRPGRPARWPWPADSGPRTTSEAVAPMNAMRRNGTRLIEAAIRSVSAARRRRRRRVRPWDGRRVRAGAARRGRPSGRAPRRHRPGRP